MRDELYIEGWYWGYIVLRWKDTLVRNHPDTKQFTGDCIVAGDVLDGLDDGVGDYNKTLYTQCNLTVINKYIN